MTKETNEGKEKTDRRKNLFIQFILASLIITLAGAVVFLFLSKKVEEGVGLKKSKNAKKSAQTVIIDFDPITVNLLDPSGRRYLQVKLSLEVADKKAEEEIKKKEPKIKDSILGVLSGKTVEEIIIPDAKERIKAEVLKKMKEDLGEDLVLSVYITQLIVE